MYAPTHNTKSTQRTATLYQRLAIYKTAYTGIAQSETIYTNYHLWLERVESITTSAKRNLTRSQNNSLSEIFHAMRYIQVRKYSDTMHEKR